ncbi:hypothetical protein [Parasitella parasitica]|uniref:Poly(A) RNA polymerase mitochondrial-like central palm domain-containing protein n=1 Tax=Parasitella parasitica TaxID=35722 RepID=A0A0B7NBA2_9FUNG|nr:hypothetical protein [Parasitella parasitica]
MLPLNFCLNVLQDLYLQARWSPDQCVSLHEFENEMRLSGSDELDEIERACCGFKCFMYYCLRKEHIFSAFYERFGYGFVFVEAEDYYSEGFDGHECNECRFTDPLFLLIEHNKFESQEHKTKKAASLRLESELFKFYQVISAAPYDKNYSALIKLCILLQDNAMTLKTVRDRNRVINKISAMIEDVWPNLSFRVDYFGSTRTHLASDDSDLDIAIVIPQFVNASRDTSELRSIGMIDVLAIQNASVPICKFTDPETGLHCDINASSSLGVENSQLIDDYRKLDKRVGPFLYALKYFVKKRGINDSESSFSQLSPLDELTSFVLHNFCIDQGGTLSSYAYCLLGIYYLMGYNCNDPIVPNLQDLTDATDECTGRKCKFGKARYFVENQRVRYHDCVEVVSQTKYQMPREPVRRGSPVTTRWDSYCHDNLGEVVLDFFKWASNLENLTRHMSIRYASGEIPNPPRKWFKKSMVIQDPFIESKNVAQSCSEAGLNRIQSEFERAAKLLEETDMTFVDICKSQTHLQLNDRSTATVVQVPIKMKPKNKRNRNRFRQRLSNNNQGFNENSNQQNAAYIGMLEVL